MITLVQSYFVGYPAQSKLWVFMAERKLNTVEKKVVNTYMQQFIPQWHAHGSALKAGYELIYDQFLVVAVDESPASASGCSIDSLTRYVQMMESKLGISFTDRMLVGYETENGIETEKLSEFKAKVKNGELSGDTVIFNNSVFSLNEFWDEWQQPLDKSWAANLLPA